MRRSATHFIGFNTGRWDYINSVSDAMAWDRVLRQSQHRRDHDDLRLHAALRGSRAPRRAARRTRSGQFALWQGGMEPNIPVGSETGVANAMKRARGRRRARAARRRLRQVGRPLEDGPHRPAGVGKAGQANQLGRPFRRSATQTPTRPRCFNSSPRRAPSAARAIC